MNGDRLEKILWNKSQSFVLEHIQRVIHLDLQCSRRYLAEKYCRFDVKHQT